MRDFKLVPIMNDHGKYRVPVWVHVHEDRYTVCVGDNTYRYYTEDTVPPEIKATLAMVRAFPMSERFARGYDGGVAEGPQAYSPPDTRLIDIGWQLSETSYILVLDRNLLMHMHMTGKGNN